MHLPHFLDDDDRSFHSLNVSHYLEECMSLPHLEGRSLPEMTKLPSKMSSEEFVATFHDIYESTPSIPRTCFSSMTSSHDTAEAMHKLLSTVFNGLPDSSKLSILKAHPYLTGPTSTHASSSEQASRGLDRLPQDMRQQFHDLNRLYEERYGWPFIIPVKDYTVADIISVMQRRFGTDEAVEFREACRCVDRIARIRVDDWFAVNHAKADGV